MDYGSGTLLTQNIILFTVFVAVLILAFSTLRVIANRRQVRRNLDAANRPSAMSADDIDRVLGSGNEVLRYYLDVIQHEDKDSLRMRLVQAGFFGQGAIRWFNLIRTGAAILVLLAVQVIVPLLAPTARPVVVLIISGIMAALVFILASAVLENIGKRRMVEFRKLFPDFMDLLLVCVDAGLSIDAALDRVTREYLATTPDFGLQLSLVNLEVRAGRSLHEALTALSDRIGVEEARTLGVLFRQSQELGSSVTQTLRIFAREMRQTRMIRAEEKANALPIKLLFPMALFMFPVNLIIVIVPILLVILEMFTVMAPQVTP